MNFLKFLQKKLSNENEFKVRIEKDELVFKNGRIPVPDELLDHQGLIDFVSKNPVVDIVILNQMLIVLLHSDSSLSNVWALNFNLEIVWKIEPAPFPPGWPAYQWIEVREPNNTLVVFDGRGDFEVDTRTGKLGRMICGPR